jgi:hypothetical protein
MFAAKVKGSTTKARGHKFINFQRLKVEIFYLYTSNTIIFQTGAEDGTGAGGLMEL